MRLIVQPDGGLTPLLTAFRRAKTSIDLVVFRSDRAELEKALSNAVARGVTVRALIAHTNKGGEKALRKLEMRLLESGVTVARTADDLPRYHGKLTIVDSTMFVLGFNYTKRDIEDSRSFGIEVRDKGLVKEGRALFEADISRQPYSPSSRRLVISPETSRSVLTEFLRGARKQLCIYDDRLTDKLMLRALRERAAAGVEIKVIGRTSSSGPTFETRKLPDLRLHVRAIIRDGSRAFVGSQSLRKIELDARREVGVIVTDMRIIRKMQSVFDSDWEAAADKKKEDASAKDAKKEEKKEAKKEEKKEEKKAEAKEELAAAK